MSLVFTGFREHDVFEEDKACKGILDGIWADLGVKKGPTWLPNRIQNGAKMISKNDQKIRSVLDRSSDELPRQDARKTIRAGAVEGVRGRHKSLPQRTWIGIGFRFVDKEWIYTP